jgi:phage FluMu protein Com
VTQCGRALVQVRCPACNRLACEAARGSLLRVKCSRCGEMFERYLRLRRRVMDSSFTEAMTRVYRTAFEAHLREWAENFDLPEPTTAPFLALVVLESLTGACLPREFHRRTTPWVRRNKPALRNHGHVLGPKSRNARERRVSKRKPKPSKRPRQVRRTPCKGRPAPEPLRREMHSEPGEPVRSLSPLCIAELSGSDRRSVLTVRGGRRTRPARGKSNLGKGVVRTGAARVSWARTTPFCSGTAPPIGQWRPRIQPARAVTFSALGRNHDSSAANGRHTNVRAGEAQDSASAAEDHG